VEAAGPSARGAISEHRPRAPHRRTGAGCVAESWDAAASASASASGTEGGGLFPGGGGARPPSRRRGGRSKPFSAPSPSMGSASVAGPYEGGDGRAPVLG